MKGVEPIFAACVAEGKKYFECTVQKGMFNRLRAGDLFIVTKTKSGGLVAAVGVVAHAAVRAETRRSVLECMLPTEQHGNLHDYLGRASAFDYVQFDRVFDLTHLSVTKKRTCCDAVTSGTRPLSPGRRAHRGPQ